MAQVVQHMHCLNCGQAIAWVRPEDRTPETETCTAACAKSRADLIARRKRTMYTLYAVMGFLTLLLLLMQFAPGLFG